MTSSPSFIIYSFWFKFERHVTFPFIWTHRSHYRVINWPNLNIVVSRGIRRLKEGKKWGKGQWVEQTNTYNIYGLSFPFYMDVVHGVPKQSTITPKTSWSQINTTNIIIMETYEILLEFPKCDVANAFGKTELIKNFLDTRLLQNFNL